MINGNKWYVELNSRRTKVWELIKDQGCDVGLVYGSQEHSQNFRYLTNFAPLMGEMWGIQTGPTEMKCVLNFHWELVEARQRSGLSDWFGEFDPLPTVTKILKELDPIRVAVVGLDRMPVVAYEKIRSDLPMVTFIDLSEDVVILRRQKSELEVQMLQEAVRITDLVIDAVRADLRPGLTEYEVQAKIMYYFHSRGITELAFTPLVMSGQNEPVLVREPTNRVLQEGDTILVDIGGAYNGYQADVTRTFVLGQPSIDQRRAWDTILEAHRRVLAKARPGVACTALHEAAVEVIEKAGYILQHRIGHGIGLATSFEWPSLDTETSPLKPGMTIAIEPGIYTQGCGSMKLEDSLLITEDGNEFLSRSSRKLSI